MIHLNYIQEYVLLAENLSFSKTAELSFITQPALSKHIALIEKEMGTKLFRRTTREVMLTPAGEMVYNAFSAILKLYGKAKKEAQSFKESAREKIVINSPYYWTGDYTEELVNLFMKSYPQCEVIIQSCQPCDGLEGLKKGDCDIFICCEMHGLDYPISGISFAKEEIRVFMSNEHPLSRKSKLSLSDFNDEIFIYSKGFEEGKNRNLEALALQGIFPSEVKCIEQIDTLGLLLQQKKGLCILPYCLRHLDRSYIVNRPLDPPIFTDMNLFYRLDNFNPALKDFLGVMMQYTLSSASHL